MKHIIRGEKSGVFYGEIKERNGCEITITNCRRLWYWDGACSLSELAVNGTTKPNNCKFTVTVPEITVMDAIEILSVSSIAQKSIDSVKEWKYEDR